MKLKPIVKVDYDKENELYHFSIERDLSNTFDKPRKIMSRQVPELLGINPFCSIGKAILDRMGFLTKEYIEPFYTVRGAIAEYFAKLYIEQKYKEKEQSLVLKAFQTETENYDMFFENEKFGGVTDIKIFQPFEAVVEVKSKNQDGFVKIAKQGQIPEEEVKQGEVLTYLSNYSKLIMAYVFTKEDTEKKIKDYVEKKEYLDWSNSKKLDGTWRKPQQKTTMQMVGELQLKLNDFYYFLKGYEINKPKIEYELQDCWKTLIENTNNRSDTFSLHKKLFDTKSKKDLQDLNNFIKEQNLKSEAN